MPVVVEARISRPMKITLVVLLVGVLGGVLYLRSVQSRMDELGQTQRVEQEARREVLKAPITTPTDTKEKARLYWFSTSGGLAAEEVELQLSTDAVQRSKQLIDALIGNAPSPARRTLPADTVLHELYILPDGTVVADFSQALATGTPPGILSEQLVVESIARTLAANLRDARRLKIVIEGQETETLAGHLDLTGLFDLRGRAASPSAELTPSAAPGKLGN